MSNNEPGILIPDETAQALNEWIKSGGYPLTGKIRLPSTKVQSWDDFFTITALLSKTIQRLSNFRTNYAVPVNPKELLDYQDFVTAQENGIKVYSGILLDWLRKVLGSDGR